MPTWIYKPIEPATSINLAELGDLNDVAPFYMITLPQTDPSVEPITIPSFTLAEFVEEAEIVITPEEIESGKSMGLNLADLTALAELNRRLLAEKIYFRDAPTLGTYIRRSPDLSSLPANKPYINAIDRIYGSENQRFAQILLKAAQKLQLEKEQLKTQK